jgi:hypothetical protein
MRKSELIEHLMQIKGDPIIRVQLPFNGGTMGLGGRPRIKECGRTTYIGLNTNDHDSKRVMLGD